MKTDCRLVELQLQHATEIHKEYSAMLCDESLSVLYRFISSLECYKNIYQLTNLQLKIDFKFS